MRPQSQFGRRHIWAVAVAVFLLPTSVFAAPAARVEFAFGSVTAEAADGRVRTLQKGAAVEAGETVNTNEGRAQLRFTDDGFVSLHSQTVFRIEEYRWSGVTDGSERVIFRLLKGGLRTVTGMLSKINKKAYRMSTEVATIGIRGTEYTMQLNGDLSGSVAEGEIEVCNAGGCLAVAPGLSYYVPDANTKPIFSNKQTSLAPPQPRSERSVVRGTASDAARQLGRASRKMDDPVKTRGNRLQAATTNGLIGFTQGAADSLLGGTALDQSPQDMTASAGGILTGKTSKRDSTTGGMPDTAAAATGGMVDAVTGVAGTLAYGINGSDGLGSIKRGF
jgi:hypothetical protein